jgi:ATP-dependent Clp protease ATP-binding subunit ClpX
MWGKTWKTLFSDLLQNASYDVKRAERGIVYVDEIDKTSRKAGSPVDHPGRFGRRGATSAFENFGGHRGGCASPRGRKHPQQEYIQVNTTNILFICGGAFEGFDKVIEQRLGEAGLGSARKRNLRNA